MRPRVVLTMLATALLGAILLAAPPVRAGLAAAGARTGAGEISWHNARPALVSGQKAPPVPYLAVPRQGVTLPTGLTFVGWSLVDRKTGRSLGHSAGADTTANYTESMIKAWIAADYLSRTAANGGHASQTDLSQLRSMIIHSDDRIASHYYALNGKDASIKRLDQVCGVHSHVAIAGWWSYTTMTPDDAARFGQCLAGGAAGQYTDLLLDWMREVTGSVRDQPVGGHTGGGRWGIISALPPALASQTSIKNGWEPEIENHVWHVNCLAITPGQVLSVMVRYRWTSPNGDWHYADNLATGADACRAVAAQLVVSPEL